jgi:hypothetical protein
MTGHLKRLSKKIETPTRLSIQHSKLLKTKVSKDSKPRKTYRFYKNGKCIEVPWKSYRPRNNPGRYRIPPDYRIPSSYTNRRELYETGWNTLWDDPTNYDRKGQLKPIHPSYSSTKPQR